MTAKTKTARLTEAELGAINDAAQLPWIVYFADGEIAARTRHAGLAARLVEEGGSIAWGWSRKVVWTDGKDGLSLRSARDAIEKACWRRAGLS